VTCTYTQLSEGKFVVPVGVGSVHVVASGSAGAATFGAPGGPGAQVSANLDVTFGVPLFVEVGIGAGAGERMQPVEEASQTYAAARSPMAAAPRWAARRTQGC
jgi:hypothetical protein